jgi:Mrp family chromosome partitioning ATPase
MITSMLAVLFQRRNYKTAILDADITGPSIPKIFGLKPGVSGCEEGIIPAQTTTGIEVMSVNLLLDEETTPVVWRGPVIAGTVKQFWSDVVWGYVDYMFVDMPPGTGDVPLTVFQSLPLDGIVIMTTPQDLVSMIVAKAVNMAKTMNVPILGIVENMSYALCPDCGKQIPLFGESHIDEVAQKANLDVLARLPLDPKLTALCDKGALELMENDYLENAADIIERRLEEKA